MIGKVAKVDGAVSPAKTGQKVSLQLKKGKSWTTVSNAKTKAGVYSLKLNPASPGRLTYRVVAWPTKPTKPAAFSASFRVNVYQWHKVADLDLVDYEIDEYDETLNVNGNPYPRSFGLDATGSFVGFLEVNTNRKCSTLKTTLGVWDESETGSVAGVEISGDGNALHEATYALGEADRLNLSITNVLRLRVDALGLQNEFDSYLVVGSPQVLCMF